VNEIAASRAEEQGVEAFSSFPHHRKAKVAGKMPEENLDPPFAGRFRRGMLFFLY